MSYQVIPLLDTAILSGIMLWWALNVKIWNTRLVTISLCGKNVSYERNGKESYLMSVTNYVRHSFSQSHSKILESYQLLPSSRTSMLHDGKVLALSFCDFGYRFDIFARFDDMEVYLHWAMLSDDVCDHIHFLAVFILISYLQHFRTERSTPMHFHQESAWIIIWCPHLKPVISLFREC